MGRVKAIQSKLKSRRGASITFALLLFLVCAVVSTVVIVAASATAGRMSQRAATDQRYYAVTSAAGLLRDEFDGATAVVEYSFAEGEESAVAPKVKRLEGVSEADHILLADASERLARKLALPAGEGGYGADRAFKLTTSVPGAAYLNCDIKEYVLAGEKQLVFEIRGPSKAAAEAGAEAEADAAEPPTYAMCVTFNANVRESESRINALDDGGTLRERTERTVTVTWTLAGVRKGAYIDM